MHVYIYLVHIYEYTHQCITKLKGFSDNMNDVSCTAQVSYYLVARVRCIINSKDYGGIWNGKIIIMDII